MITTLSQLVAQAESNNNLYAVRFEPKYSPSQDNVLKCVAANRPMSYATAQTLCASSFGMYQIMLDNVYWLGYKGTTLDFWKSPDIQLDYFNQFIRKRGINFSLDEVMTDQEKRDKFARRYNGAVQYGDRLVSIYKLNQGK